MNFNSFDALLITNPTNVRYITGFVGVAPEEREAYCLLTNSQTYLFVNQLYVEYANKLALQSKQSSNNPIIQSSNNPIKIVEISREEPFAKKLAETFQGNRLGFEENDLTVAEYQKLKKELQSITLVPTKDRIEELRMVKRKDEITCIRAAAKLTDQCFDFILGKLRTEVTEKEIAWEIEMFIRSRGAQLAFSPIVAFGKNTSMPHYQPAESCKLTADSLILLDFGARVNGYCSDMTRVVFVGKPKDEWMKAYETVLTAQQKALEYLSRQRSGGTADRIALKVIQKTNFPAYPHSLGHGVGLDIHEAPRLTIKKDEILRVGMVVTVEPGIYMEGSYGIRIEDLVLLKEDGIEILSKSKKEMIIL